MSDLERCTDLKLIEKIETEIAFALGDLGKAEYLLADDQHRFSHLVEYEIHSTESRLRNIYEHIGFMKEGLSKCASDSSD